MNIIGENPYIIFWATVTGTVLVSEDHKDLIGKNIDFSFSSIQWDSREVIEGGIAVSIPGHYLTIIEIETMKIVSVL